MLSVTCAGVKPGETERGKRWFLPLVFVSKAGVCDGRKTRANDTGTAKRYVRLTRKSDDVSHSLPQDHAEECAKVMHSRRSGVVSYGGRVFQPKQGLERLSLLKDARSDALKRLSQT